jgi:hypothetical protein
MNFIKRTVCIAGAAIVLTACATTPSPEYPKTHPANPEAPAASAPPAPSSLATYRSFGNERKPSGDAANQPATESGHAHQH